MLAHPERHIRVRLGGLTFLKFVGQLVSLGGLDFIDFSVEDIQVGHPNIVGIPRDFAFGHPERIDFDFAHRTFVGFAICLSVGTSHFESPAWYRKHFDFGLRMLDQLDVPFHLVFFRCICFWNRNRIVARGLGLLAYRISCRSGRQDCSDEVGEKTESNHSAVQVEPFRNETFTCEVSGQLIAKRHDFDIAKFDRIGMAGKSDVSAGAILARVGCVAHVFVDGGQVGIENSGSVKLDLDL